MYILHLNVTLKIHNNKLIFILRGNKHNLNESDPNLQITFQITDHDCKMIRFPGTGKSQEEPNNKGPGCHKSKSLKTVMPNDIELYFCIKQFL